VLLTNGKVRCWGKGTMGRLGYGNTNTIGDDEHPATAGDVSIGGTVTQISAGRWHTCALLSTKKVRCWGSGGSGELGQGYATGLIGDNEDPSTLGTVPVGGDVTQISTGHNFTCALLSTKKVRCWGTNAWGQLGYGHKKAIGDDETPASAGDVNLGGDALQVEVGTHHSCALLVGNKVKCWGYGGSGGLGYGKTTNVGDTNVPADVGFVNLGTKTVTRIAVGYASSCAIFADGSLKCWGTNGYAKLGLKHTDNIGDNESPYSYTNVGAAVVDVCTHGFLHTCAALTSGQVRCWGFGGHGATAYPPGSTIGDNEHPSSVSPIALY